ncbi:MAG TPA: hypothetical protein VLW44_01365 [Streptosporangiaceae bacterium]|nr:hypothetical protein [Streptosporangiaceae bacterium]
MPVRPAGQVVGIDFGHAHVGVAVADTAGTVLAERRLGADTDHRADEVLDASVRLAGDLLGQAGVPRSWGAPSPTCATASTPRR